MNQITPHSETFQPDLEAMSGTHGATAVRELTPRGAIWLCALGAAARTGITQDGIGQTIAYLSQPSWEPSGDLIGQVVYDLVGEAHLTPQAPLSGEPRFVTTGRGRGAFMRLMMSRIGYTLSPFGQACLRFKLAFLDMLEAPLRSQLLELMARTYERELILRRNRGKPDSVGLFGESWRDSENEHLRRHLVQLRGYVYEDPAREEADA